MTHSDYLLNILAEVRHRMIKENPKEDSQIPILLTKLDFVKEMIQNQEIKTLSGMILVIFYTADIRNYSEEN